MNLILRNFTTGKRSKNETTTDKKDDTNNDKPDETTSDKKDETTTNDKSDGKQATNNNTTDGYTDSGHFLVQSAPLPKTQANQSQPEHNETSHFVIHDDQTTVPENGTSASSPTKPPRIVSWGVHEEHPHTPNVTVGPTNDTTHNDNDAPVYNAPPANLPFFPNASDSNKVEQPLAVSPSNSSTDHPQVQVVPQIPSPNNSSSTSPGEGSFPEHPVPVPTYDPNHVLVHPAAEGGSAENPGQIDDHVTNGKEGKYCNTYRV